MNNSMNSFSDTGSSGQGNGMMHSGVGHSYVDSYMPPAASHQSVMSDASSPSDVGGGGSSMGSQSHGGASTKSEGVSQALEDQNIFHLLGITQATEEEKEKFLDELQGVIWEDFVEDDADLLLTEGEYAEFVKIKDKAGVAEEERQAQMIAYLEKFVPELEKIMLEKALELKEEMMQERIKELIQVYQTEPANLEKVQRAQMLVSDDQWRDAADLLNSLPK